jgi:hypothetical protein
LIGTFTSFLIPETKRKTLEELTGTLLQTNLMAGEGDYAVEQPAVSTTPEKGEELA